MPIIFLNKWKYQSYNLICKINSFAILLSWEQLIFFQQQQMLKLIKLPSKSNQEYKEQKGLIQ